MAIEHVITRLYEHRINCGVQSVWDKGLLAWLGGDTQERHERWFSFHERDKAAEWLEAKALELFRDRFETGPGGLPTS